jgi:hypothetical protein
MAPITADEGLQARSSVMAQLAGSVTLTGNAFTCNAIWLDSKFKAAFAIFESVELVSASVVLSVAPLETGFVQLAFTPYELNAAGTVTATVEAMSSSLHYAQSFVSHEQPINLTLELPPGHNFGHELRGATLGNPPPVLSWRVIETPDSNAKSVTGRLHYKYTLIGHGRSPPVAATR